MSLHMKFEEGHHHQPPQEAYTLAAFAHLFGKERSWAYRQQKKGRVQTINGYGAALVSRREVERILGEGGLS